MAAASVQEPRLVVRIKHAGFWKRAGATLVDGVPKYAFYVVIRYPIIYWIFGVQNFRILPMNKRLKMQLVVYIAVLTFGWLYGALLESSSRQATVGKMVFGLKVTDLGGHRISFGRALKRHLGKVISLLYLGLGFLMVAYREDKQALHDMIAGTAVEDCGF